MNLDSVLNDFLLKWSLKEAPLLLGLSMGEDSTTLFHALIKAKAAPFLHVIYVNHQLRSEAKSEAEYAEKLAKRCGVTFHYEEVKGLCLSMPNLEDACRKARFNAFDKIYRKIGAKALLLAHHQQDHAETVFKRMFEGAGVFALSGLSEFRLVSGMNVARPFLSVPKKELSNYLKKIEEPFFFDSTNLDESYLRARMRKSIFPEIEKQFGKSSSKNLAQLGSWIEDLSKYLEKQSKRYFNCLVSGPFGDYLDLQALDRIEPIEFESFLRKYFSSKKQSISKSLLDSLTNWVTNREMEKSAHAGAISIRYEHDKLFFLKKGSFLPFEGVTLSQMKQGVQVGEYEFIVENCKRDQKHCDWKDFWKGELVFAVPEGSCLFQTPSYQEKLHGKRIKSLYAESKVPTFFRDWVFGVYVEGCLSRSVLTGTFSRQNNTQFFKLRIYSKNPAFSSDAKAVFTL